MSARSVGLGPTVVEDLTLGHTHTHTHGHLSMEVGQGTEVSTLSSTYPTFGVNRITEKIEGLRSVFILPLNLFSP